VLDPAGFLSGVDLGGGVSSAPEGLALGSAKPVASEGGDQCDDECRAGEFNGEEFGVKYRAHAVSLLLTGVADHWCLDRFISLRQLSKCVLHSEILKVLSPLTVTSHCEGSLHCPAIFLLFAVG